MRHEKKYSPLALGLFIEAPLIALAWLAWIAGTGQAASADFAIFRHAGRLVAHGRTPYGAVASLADQHHFVYPEPFAYLFSPFALIGPRIGAILFLLMSAAALMAALRLLRVADWRVYGAALLAPPVFDALGVGSISLFLLLAAAAAWRLRHSGWAGVLVAVAVAAKLFMWPLLVWLIVTRRFRAALAAFITFVVVLAAWAATDPGSIGSYPRMLRALEIAQPSSYSVRALLLAAGVPAVDGLTVIIAMAATIAVVAVTVTRGERQGFSAALVVSLFATPLLWLHYLVLLLVPLMLHRPRLTGPFLLLACLWVTPGTGPGSQVAWRSIVVLAVISFVGLATFVRPKQRTIELSPIPPVV
jgi:alpha-1,2-mannosyltransferase